MKSLLYVELDPHIGLWCEFLKDTLYVELVTPHVLEWFMQRQLLNDECLVVEWWMIWSDDNKILTNVASIGMMYIAYSRGMGHQNMSYPLTENISAHILAYVVKSKFL